jgi:hypothetical protein
VTVISDLGLPEEGPKALMMRRGEGPSPPITPPSFAKASRPAAVTSPRVFDRRRRNNAVSSLVEASTRSGPPDPSDDTKKEPPTIASGRLLLLLLDGRDELPCSEHTETLCRAPKERFVISNVT